MTASLKRGDVQTKHTYTHTHTHTEDSPLFLVEGEQEADSWWDGCHGDGVRSEVRCDQPEETEGVSLLWLISGGGGVRGN